MLACVIVSYFLLPIMMVHALACRLSHHPCETLLYFLFHLRLQATQMLEIKFCFYLCKMPQNFYPLGLGCR